MLILHRYFALHSLEKQFFFFVCDLFGTVKLRKLLEMNVKAND